MTASTDKPLIVQPDCTVLLNAEHPAGAAARERLSLFAELVKRPGGIHTYRMTPLSLWNAASTGMTANQMMDWLTAFSRYEIPFEVESLIRKLVGRYGKLTLMVEEGILQLIGDPEIMDELVTHSSIGEWLTERMDHGRWRIRDEGRGPLKQELTRFGFPVVDLAGYHTGEALPVSLLKKTKKGRPFELRDYQKQAVQLFHREGTVQGGSGVIVLPCGAGKTVVGIAALAELRSATLILTSNATSVKQWKQELLDKTTLESVDVGEYAGELKQVCPVTIATYQILTSRKRKGDPFPHMKLFSDRDWGLIIYDEVHLLPAPIFRKTADIQATRRLGLTATLVREDGCAEDVFSLIGPKQYDLSWRSLEDRGYLAELTCREIRVPLPEAAARRYYASDLRPKGRIAAENPAKLLVVKKLLARHAGMPCLIIGQYLQQLHRLADELEAPLLTGELPQQERDKLYEAFKSGQLSVLIVSKVANFAVDLPDAAVAIQVSGSFGSRQEEAQRIGRIIRPKRGDNRAYFYTIVSDATVELEYAMKRQLFMLEQGYHYELETEVVFIEGGEQEAVSP